VRTSVCRRSAHTAMPVEASTMRPATISGRRTAGGRTSPRRAALTAVNFSALWRRWAARSPLDLEERRGEPGRGHADHRGRRAQPGANAGAPVPKLHLLRARGGSEICEEAAVAGQPEPYDDARI